MQLRLLALPFVLLAACADDPSPEQTELESHREQFTQTMQGSYKFTWRKSCECTTEWTQPIRITVQQGSIISAIAVETNQPVSAALLADLKTIEGVFDLVQEAYNENAHSISVTYDPTTAFPASIGIDYSEQIADEEFSLQISDVVEFAAN
jgi:hypothetical protein